MLLKGLFAAIFLALALCTVGVGPVLSLFNGGIEGPSMAIIANIFVEEWNEDLTETVRDANPHLRRAVDHSRFVTSDGKHVHLPYENQDPQVVEDRQVFPAQVEQLEDADLEYKLGWISTNPTVIQNKFLDQISYDYMRSVRRRHEEVIAQRVGLRSIYEWAPEGGIENRIVRTSGNATSIKPDGAAGGDRKLATIEDLRNLRKLFHKMGLAGASLVIQCEEELYDQLASQKELQDVNLGGSTQVNREGVIDRFAGFDFLEPMTEKVPIYDNQNIPVKRPRGASAQADDNLAAIAWAEETATQAEGMVRVNVNEDRAEFYGTIVSAEMWHRAYYRRPDQLGRVALVQDHV